MHLRLGSTCNFTDSQPSCFQKAFQDVLMSLSHVGSFVVLLSHSRIPLPLSLRKTPPTPPPTTAMATTMPLPAGLQSYLANASPAQLGQLIQTLQHKQIEMGARPAQSAFSMSARAGVQAANTSRKPRTKKTKDPAASGAPKRPLNEWMAFRCKYKLMQVKCSC